MYSQFKHKRFLRPVVEEDPIALPQRNDGRYRIPRVRIKGAGAWGEWALWLHVQSEGYEPLSALVAEYQNGSTIVDPKWKYPLGLDPVLKLKPVQP